ncbi:MAG: prepilin-type N-terminal cleavage/methylation domain-containing protein [Erysipelotrichaceae bacterium]|nr:prepilin-type N-terminal cleavage/methylation domain-containing protein [Erysipelotrichaceae bacterium]
MKSLRKNLNKNGFTLIECLFSLILFSFSILLMYQILGYINKTTFYDQDIQDINGVLQIKQHLNLATNLLIDSDQLSYDYKDKQFTINVVNNNLVIQPGTNIILLDIENIEFFDDEGGLYMRLIRRKSSNCYQIYG